jgi:large subunit ribosomal protein L9
MKVVLLKNVDKLGKAGDIKEVSAGFASNFLIPNKLVKPATESAILEVEKQVKIQDAKKEELLKEYRELAKKIDGQEFEIEQKAKDGKLFGSVKAKDVLALVVEKGLKLEESNIIFAKPIKELGDFVVEIQIKDEVKAKIKLTIKEKK